MARPKRPGGVPLQGQGKGRSLTPASHCLRPSQCADRTLHIEGGGPCCQVTLAGQMAVGILVVGPRNSIGTALEQLAKGPKPYTGHSLYFPSKCSPQDMHQQLRQLRNSKNHSTLAF